MSLDSSSITGVSYSILDLGVKILLRFLFFNDFLPKSSVALTVISGIFFIKENLNVDFLKLFIESSI